MIGGLRRGALRCLFVLVLAGFAAACASIPPLPPNAPPRLSLEETTGLPGVPHSDVIEAAGESTTASGPVERDGVLISIPYRYRHTAVLTEDVVGFSITVRGVQAPAGSPGYYAGTFVNIGGAGGFGQGGQGELWCFLPSLVGGERDNICLLRSAIGTAAIAPTRLNPYLWTEFSPATGSFDYVMTPIYERRAVDIPGPLTLEYRFEGWTGDGVRLSEHAGGRSVRTFQVGREGDGPIAFKTIAGTLSISAAASDPDRAEANLGP